MCIVLMSTRLDECTDSKYLRGEKKQQKFLSEEKTTEFRLKPEKWHPTILFLKFVIKQT